MTPVSAPDHLAQVHAGTPGVYRRQAAVWNAGRMGDLYEQKWLDRIVDGLEPGAPVLDLGCGGGDPIAIYLLQRGFSVTGLDASPEMLAIARDRLPDLHTVLGDMREAELPSGQGAIIGWDSFFHLSASEQVALIPRLAAALRPGGRLLLTVGPAASEGIGSVGGEAVYHASLAQNEYAARFGAARCDVIAFEPEDPNCRGRSVLLSQRRA
ncbi:class I SAM-dependent methyltransferase [Meridianimarinicoccus aquatilis]|uniref:Class I SAM-dependent methyltransferase n=1 Tax=Meridianimarinicoccus aquatilis TaxID=2552766 RepID=A0A4R6B4U5_9RHOB|nr:class I SAM-dependent methyltransferase [Fluviibacterium aquatile]TDL90688.1 class I SAM-dependent methyltransferase [Fluviibacterium aquatile]